jgi:hypothetical protein
VPYFASWLFCGALLHLLFPKGSCALRNGLMGKLTKLTKLTGESRHLRVLIVFAMRRRSGRALAIPDRGVTSWLLRESVGGAPESTLRP